MCLSTFMSIYGTMNYNVGLMTATFTSLRFKSFQDYSVMT